MATRGTRKKKTADKPHYHHGDLRRALLDASLALISEEGFGALSLREVARRAGVTHAAPYRHFEDKEALLVAVAEEGFRVMTARMKERMARVPATEERVVACGVAYVLFAMEHPAHFRVMFGPHFTRPPAYRKYWRPSAGCGLVGGQSGRVFTNLRTWTQILCESGAIQQSAIRSHHDRLDVLLRGQGSRAPSMGVLRVVTLEVQADLEEFYNSSIAKHPILWRHLEELKKMSGVSDLQRAMMDKFKAVTDVTAARERRYLTVSAQIVGLVFGSLGVGRSLQGLVADSASIGMMWPGIVGFAATFLIGLCVIVWISRIA